MKTIKIISLTGLVSLLVLFLTVIPACNEDSDDSINTENLTTVDIKVEGMTCTGCEIHITNAVMELDGINHAKLSHTGGNAKIEFDKTKTSRDDIVAAIKGSGYKVVE